METRSIKFKIALTGFSLVRAFAGGVLAEERHASLRKESRRPAGLFPVAAVPCAPFLYMPTMPAKGIPKTLQILDAQPAFLTRLLLRRRKRMRLLRYAPSDSSTYLKYLKRSFRPPHGVLGRKPCIHIRLRRFAYQAASLRTPVRNAARNRIAAVFSETNPREQRRLCKAEYSEELRP